MRPGDFAFGPYRLVGRTRRLFRGAEPVDLSSRQFDILQALLDAAPKAIGRYRLIEVGWTDAAVTDSSLGKQIHALRLVLDAADTEAYIATVARGGYRCCVPVDYTQPTDTPDDYASIIAPHRAWTEGRAQLESLKCEQIDLACASFRRVLELHPADALLHVGMANACAMQFEATRTNASPNLDALALAETHARKARQFGQELAETWSTLGFVLERTAVFFDRPADRDESLDALNRAAAMEPKNWRVLFRLALGTFGGDRLSAAIRTLSECPHLPLPHLLASTVYVSRQAFDHAEQEVARGRAIVAAEAAGTARYSAVALFLVEGLLALSCGGVDAAHAAFDRELALEVHGRVYGRECSANTWYAKGAAYLVQGNRDAARMAIGESLARVPLHPNALACRAMLAGTPDQAMAIIASMRPHKTRDVDLALAQAVLLNATGHAPQAVEIVATALATAPPGSAGWMLPIEPLLNVRQAPDVWAAALAQLHLRAR